MKKMRIYILLLCVCCVAYSRAGESYTNAVKVTFLSWITGSTKVSYERAFAKHQTSEICGSVIGAGYDKFRNRPQGFTARYGHKFFLSGNHEGGLQGLYLRPEVIYSHYSYDVKESQLRTSARMGALLVTTGCQMNYGRLLIDAWVGGGYALGVPAETGYHHGFALWNLFGKRNDNIALSFSIRLGYCF